MDAREDSLLTRWTQHSFPGCYQCEMAGPVSTDYKYTGGY